MLDKSKQKCYNISVKRKEVKAMEKIKHIIAKWLRENHFNITPDKRGRFRQELKDKRAKGEITMQEYEYFVRWSLMTFSVTA